MKQGARVFFPQIRSRYDRELGCWVPVISLNPARAFGTTVVLLPPEAGRMEPDVLCSMLSEKLSTVTAQDWLVPVGDPLIVGIATVLMVQRLGGRLRILRWDRQGSVYEPLEVQCDSQSRRADDLESCIDQS